MAVRRYGRKGREVLRGAMAAPLPLRRSRRTKRAPDWAWLERRRPAPPPLLTDDRRVIPLSVEMRSG